MIEASDPDPVSKFQDPAYRLICVDPSHAHRFEVSVVRTDVDRREVYRIRHGAYCGEGNPLPAQPDGLERDEYDSDAIHVLARLDGVAIGTVRTTYSHDGRFLIETFVENGVPVIKIPPELPREHAAEPSRLAIDKPSVPPCVYTPFITVALHHRNYVIGRASGIQYWVMEPNARNLRTMVRLGWRMHSIGSFEHHGQKFEAVWMPLHPSHFGWELDVRL